MPITRIGQKGDGFTSTNNSSTTPLAGSATFTGTGEQNNAAQVGVMVKTDQTATLYFDFSNDGTNWDSTFPVAGFGVAAGISEFHTAVKLGRYFRVRLVNESTSAQTYLRLTTYFGDNFVPSVAPLNQTAGLDQDAIFTRNTIAQDEIVLGRRTGVTNWAKFATRDGLTAAGGEQTIWSEGSTDFVPLTAGDTFDIAYDSTTDGAGGSATGATELTFFYIDDDGLPQTAVHVLGSSGSDTTSFSGLGINRVAVSASGSNEANVNDITITDTTGGATQAFIGAEDSVTHQAIFFCGSNHQAVVKGLFINVAKLSGGSAPRVLVKGYSYNRNIQTRFETFRYLIDTEQEGHVSIPDSDGFRMTETDVLYFVADTDTNSTDIVMRFDVVEYQLD